jgi:hypothetical protein
MKTLRELVLAVEHKTKKGHYLLVTPKKTYLMPLELFEVKLNNN